MEKEKQEKTGSSIGLGIIFGLIFGAALGFVIFPDNFITGAIIGMSAGILIAALIDIQKARASKK